MKPTRALLVMAAVASSLAACGRPPLDVRQEGATTVIDVQTLGEYPSDIEGLRLIEVARQQVVWELRGTDGPQLGRIPLIVGDNPVRPPDIRHGNYEVIVPAGAATFTLAPGTHYVVEVWAREKCAAEFMTPL